MSSLLTEILISLVVIAVIGGIIGWLVRGVQVSNRESRLDNELEEHKGALNKAQGQVARLESSMKKMNQLRTSEREQLEKRIRELEPLFDIVERRDTRIRELTDELSTLQNERQSELESLQFDLSTKALLGDDDSEVERLKSELQLAQRQRDSALNRYQSQLRQIEDLENVINEKARLADQLGKRVEEAAHSGDYERDRLRAQLKSLEEQLAERDEKLALTENKKQYEIGLAEARTKQTEEELEELRARHAEVSELRTQHLARENELTREMSELRSELAEKRVAIAELESRTARSQTPIAPAPIRVVSGGASDPLFNPDNQEDLQRLKGIGQATEKKLNQLGIKNLLQIASLNDDDIVRIEQHMPNFRALSRRYKWIDNAKKITGEGSSRANRGQG